MGTSFVDHRGVGFWANDAALDIWLRLLVHEIDIRALVPAWLDELHDHWQYQAAYGGVGAIDTALNDFITDDTAKLIALSLAEGALARLARYGAVITRDELNAIAGDVPGVYWTRDAAIESFAAVGNAFIGLLKGAITSDSATAIVIR